MSMRTQIHDAVDEVAPPAPSLERSVTAFVLANDHDRRSLTHGRRAASWPIRFRGMATLVAAVLVLLLVGGTLIGIQIWRNGMNRESSPAGSLNQSELHGLEARPIVLPVVQPGAPCPYTQIVGGGLVQGDGPVYLLSASTVATTNQGDWFAPTLYYAAKRPGVVLVRGRDLVTNQPLVFAQFSYGPSGVIVAGPSLGTDLVNKKVQLHPEAVVPDSWHQPANEDLILMFAVPRATLCWGFQFDGPDFTETYVNGWDSKWSTSG
ncbi:MAG TPA: hypothetical protein VLK30_05095 [Candidatus Limnocylindrales bacterium]|nr:hypothetical protein [Candidatus Limnocylindrales bacterium]